jgi:hypothetical protein
MKMQREKGSVILIAVFAIALLATYEISAGDSCDFDENSPDPAPDLCRVDETNYFCCYTADGEDGWSVVLSLGIRP